MTTSSNTVTSLANNIEKTTMIDSSSAKKPLLLFAASPADGHTIPPSRIAGEMVKRGYEVTFIGGEQFESMLKGIGVDFVPIPSMFTQEMIEERDAIPAGIPRLLYDMKHIFVGKTAERWQILKEVLERLRVEKPGREIIILNETAFMGTNPLVLGAPLPKGFTTRPKVISLHAIPYIATSIDVGPFGPGLPPDATESGRARNQLLNQMMVAGPFAEIIAEQDQILKDLGATKVLAPEVPFHHWMVMHDTTLQLCPPSLEYPRSDMPSNIKFAGCPTPRPIAADFKYPEWWEDVTRGDRKVVTVTQGTVANDYSDLLIPTIKALAGHDDLVVVAILGHRGVSLPKDITIPANTRVIDYLPYDAVLPHSSVFVMNAGYGGFLHGITNGVPMVLGGESEDKPEIAMRGAWSGVAVNLRTGRPSPAAVRAGVERVLGDESFKTRVEEIRRENAAISVFDVAEREILALTELEG
ncbi:hypothetical protein BGZ61DRAFT_490927 [Ilyonectria robusta]|uniref:uncharacterized protein n=1 Tax=Ilyonectria robusta TaxID=1079257 RepID=UPI001E8CC22D|nr:uncharacterized protein BGZ61DRAFT_490927 [Ilyonectria robusta]KAH8735283.1 hypothetical protein BGZ61DRAFT_490927 [Ilyonectria robusta]